MVRSYGWFIAALFVASWASCPKAAWADSVETALMPGQVIEGHAKWEEDCAKCHMRFNKAAQTTLCLGCHRDVSGDVSKQIGYHGRFKEARACRECHSEHKGRKENIAPITDQTFTHADTDFPLRGVHADPKKVECRACHKPKAQYRAAPSDCYACHKKDDKHKGKFGPACADCHTEQNWKEMKFDHSKTKFPLRGKHARIRCQACHGHDRYKNTHMDCYACHRKDDYHKGVFGPQCDTCHGESNWKTSRFNHDKDTKYPLKGKHVRTKCESCHKVPVTKEKTPTKCLTCHQKDDKHKGTYGAKCESCHVEKGWKTITFDHDRDTKYPLKGKHKTTKCENCHKGHLYKDKTPTLCLACHKEDDKHKGAYGEKCESCHVEKDWKTITFDHDRDTKYPLKGKHKTTKCESCHKGHLYKDKLKTDCYSCHQKDDKHKGQEGKLCHKCHNERDWKDTTFDHGQTSFPLLGKHQKVECKKCHKTTAFKDAPSDCTACHEKEDVHKRRLGTQCEACHNARDWKIWDFDHDARTRFKLTGGHKRPGCYECHKTPMGKKVTAPDSCVSCHKKDDVHDGSYGPQCERCHETSLWKNMKPGTGAFRLR